jgi:hypothetical protein
MNSDWIYGIIGIIIGLFIIRAFGAWMLRIDEVIKYEKEIIEELKKLNNNSGNNNQ